MAVFAEKVKIGVYARKIFVIMYLHHTFSLKNDPNFPLQNC